MRESPPRAHGLSTDGRVISSGSLLPLVVSWRAVTSATSSVMSTRASPDSPVSRPALIGKAESPRLTQEGGAFADSLVTDPGPLGDTATLTTPHHGHVLAEARLQRDQAWEKLNLPGWVNPPKIGLDRFFTRPAVAEACLSDLLDVMRRDGADLSRHHFIEPAAGTGVFLDLLPPDRRTGIDIVPAEGCTQADFLSWSPPGTDRLVVVGNPPFGYRAWLALAFLNHAATFASHIGMILPMAFQSEGKGSPKRRVRGAELARTAFLPGDSFVTADGRPARVNAIWQVWRRGTNTPATSRSCDSWVDVFTVDTRAVRRCGQNRIKEATWFLQRTFYGDPPSLVRSFDRVRYGCGYGIVLKRSAQALTRLLEKTDWRRYSNLAAHNCRHISMYHIRAAVVDGGFHD